MSLLSSPPHLNSQLTWSVWSRGSWRRKVPEPEKKTDGFHVPAGTIRDSLVPAASPGERVPPDCEGHASARQFQ
jgi:hypothetical protein